MKMDISEGIEPVIAFTDIVLDEYQFRVAGRQYAFPRTRCPFTLKDNCADKALILKHG